MNEDDFFSLPDQPSKLGPVFSAGFDSACDDCGLTMFEGDEIRADGEGGFVHAECADE